MSTFDKTCQRRANGGMHAHLDCPTGAERHPASMPWDPDSETCRWQLGDCLHNKQVDMRNTLQTLLNEH